MAEPSPDLLLKTPLHAAHVALGARMVPFAGYDMPVQYPTGILTEHSHTRSAAGLFDVSHMGQCVLSAEDHETAALALEGLVPADILNLQPGRQRYSQFLNEGGGILDDLMVARPPLPVGEGRLVLVVNAARKEADFALLRAHLPPAVTMTIESDRALLALQGPEAAAVLAKHCPDAAALPFMGMRYSQFDGIEIAVSRSGYTGEDGFEISVGDPDAQALWEALLADPRVRPIGLGARDSLRLEAGLCLYGHDIDETTSPIEAGLAWSIQKRRREGGGFPGAARVQRELRDGPARRRVGLLPEGRSPVREGAAIASEAGEPIGVVTSGGFGPTAGRAVAMGYVAAGMAQPGTKVSVDLRGKALPAAVTAMPIVPHRFVRA
jgi:aminomethyltransferase